MNPVVFMPRIMPHCGGGGDFADFSDMLLTFIIAGVILVILGILFNILHIKFSNGFEYTPIYWDDIKPTLDNSFLGYLCGFFGCIFIGASLIVGLVAGVYWCIITL